MSIEIVLARAGGPDLEPVLQDYRRRYQLSETAVLDALFESLSARHAQALLALRGGQPAGAIIVSQREQEGTIRLLHALDPAPEVAAALLEQAEQALRQGGARQVNGSLLLPPQDPLLGVLRQHGYQVTPRARMVLDLSETQPAPYPPPGFQLLPWQDRRQDAAVALIEEAHRDSADVDLHPEFAGRAGVQRMFSTVLAGRYGRFDPALAWMVLAGDDLAGLSLNVWHAALQDQGFILDLAVATAHRRRGLARTLVAATARSFQEAGAPKIGLAVTLANRPAVTLYEGLGFRVERYFSVLCKELER